jgi:hypothetical protein
LIEATIDGQPVTFTNPRFPLGHLSNLTASQCFDGDPNNGMCHSAGTGGGQARLLADFNAPNGNLAVTLTNRDDCCSNRITGFDVRVTTGGNDDYGSGTDAATTQTVTMSTATTETFNYDLTESADTVLEYVSTLCTPGTITGAGSTDTTTTSCGTVSSGQRVTAVCNQGDATKVGTPATIVNCSGPGTDEYVSTLCTPGTITNITNSQDTQTTSCGSIGTDQYTEVACTQGSASVVGSAATVSGCDISVPPQRYASVACQPGSLTSAGQNTQFAPCDTSETCNVPSGYYITSITQATCVAGTGGSNSFVVGSTTGKTCTVAECSTAGAGEEIDTECIPGDFANNIVGTDATFTSEPLPFVPHQGPDGTPSHYQASDGTIYRVVDVSEAGSNGIGTGWNSGGEILPRLANMTEQACAERCATSGLTRDGLPCVAWQFGTANGEKSKSNGNTSDGLQNNVCIIKNYAHVDTNQRWDYYTLYEEPSDETTYSCVENYRNPGTAIGSTTTEATIDDCEDRCTNQPDCVLFVYNSTQQCFLKSTDGGDIGQTGTFVCRKTTGSGGTNICTGYTGSGNALYPASDGYNMCASLSGFAQGNHQVGFSNTCADRPFGRGNGGGDYRTWQQSVDLCASRGARLCSPEELNANVSRGMGHSYDAYWNWTTEACSGGHILTRGSSVYGTTHECYADNTTSVGNVRTATSCCGDYDATLSICTS